MLGDPILADDAAQDVFVKVYHSLSKFRGDAAFSTWLHRIASNHCLDLLRQKKRQKTESWDALVEKEGEAIERLLAAPPETGATLENADLVRRALACLTPDYREILVLRETQGFSYEELTKILDCSLDAVKARLARARHQLEEKLRHFLDLENV
jgi:RNA polymerase sigma-70 factor (ECF subfamily)